jgi:hypothetical protein
MCAESGDSKGSERWLNLLRIELDKLFRPAPELPTEVQCETELVTPRVLSVQGGFLKVRQGSVDLQGPPEPARPNVTGASRAAVHSETPDDTERNEATWPFPLKLQVQAALTVSSRTVTRTASVRETKPDSTIEFGFF